VIGEALGEHGELGLHEGAHGEVVLEEFAEEGLGFGDHSLVQEEGILGVELFVRGGFLHPGEVKPLVGKIVDEAFAFGVGEEPVHLGAKDFGFAEAAFPCGFQEFGIGWPVPKPVGEAGCEGEVRGGGGMVRGGGFGVGGMEEKFRGGEDGDVGAAHGVLEAVVGGEAFLDEGEVGFDVFGEDLAAEGLGKEVGEEASGVLEGLVGMDGFEGGSAL
jgi:hypothetical protein